LKSPIIFILKICIGAWDVVLILFQLNLRYKLIQINWMNYIKITWNINGSNTLWNVVIQWNNWLGHHKCQNFIFTHTESYIIHESPPNSLLWQKYTNHIISTYSVVYTWNFFHTYYLFQKSNHLEISRLSSKWCCINNIVVADLFYRI